MNGKRVIVLGGSGMLGSMVADYLSRDAGLGVTATVRTAEMAAKCGRVVPNARWALFDAAADDAHRALAVLDGHEWVINAIGMTKPMCHDGNAFEIERAIRINSLLPHWIARRAGGTGARVLQIATDCVYSGARGRYREEDAHEPTDVYGKTKSLGEVFLPNAHHLRCSIVGPEPKEYKFLIEWFRRQPPRAAVNGFVNHQWNGITTLHFAKLCHGIIGMNLELPHALHVVPGDAVSKHALLLSFARHFDRSDMTIQPAESGTVIDRTLATSRPDLNQALWEAAGHREPPSIDEMIKELAAYDYRFEGAL